MVRCSSTAMTQSQQQQIADMRVVTYDPPPQNCAYTNKLDKLLEASKWERAGRRVEENKYVKIETGGEESVGISQTHRRPREVECKSEPLFRLPLHTALYHNAPYDVIKKLVGE